MPFCNTGVQTLNPKPENLGSWQLQRENAEQKGSSLNQGPFSGPFFTKVPYKIGGLKRDPTLENYPYETRNPNLSSAGVYELFPAPGSRKSRFGGTRLW